MITIHAGQLLAKNLRFFREHVPGVYQIVKGQEPNRDVYRVHTARKVNVSTIEKYEGERWQAIHSLYDPLQEAVRWAKPALKAETREVVLFGLGFGYYVEALLALNPQLRFYIIEPDLHVFLHSLEVRDWTGFPWEQVLYLGFGSDEAALNTLHQSYFQRVHTALQIMELPAYLRLYPDIYKRFTETLKKSREEYVESMTTTLYFQKMWARNAMKNLRRMTESPSAYSLTPQFQDRLVILTASGPSLTEAIPVIKRAQEEQKAVIVAAGTSVNSLLKQGVTPDVFISYDPNEPNYHMLKPVFQSGIPFLFASTIYYRIMEEYEGPVAHFLTNQDYIYPYLDRKAKPEEIVQDAPTVTLIAMQLLLKMGCKAIYLAGQDLAYIGKQTYAAGTSAHHDAVNAGETTAFQQRLTVENNQGELAETNESFMTMISSINNFFTRNPVQNIYNLSAYGAKLKNIPYVSLEQLEAALEQEISVPFVWSVTDVNPKKQKKLLEKLYKDVQSCAYDIRHLEGLLKRMQKDDGLKPSLQEQMVLEYNNIVDRFLAKPAFIGLFYPWMQVYLQHMQRVIYEIKDLPIVKHFVPIRDLLERFVAEAKAALQFYEGNLKEQGK
ncbi:6-hydroxymethylpterin diphosphokinase MptE-like protein [Aneurinibacillus sp. UBA3580]|jgi:hypothetical protein|uniref:motility associated factor glycosyltransferase family protein n=1 Tax=Aneurinibacillus sp. UBA3580 TaxID=1946041 RepID=UPI00257E7BF8|nr:6-hydroxymethylpterin diphosphokinase MptE-like protein [Aneurinibacillus sp. UBA3580]